MYLSNLLSLNTSTVCCSLVSIMGRERENNSGNCGDGVSLANNMSTKTVSRDGV